MIFKAARSLSRAVHWVLGAKMAMKTAAFAALGAFLWLWAGFSLLQSLLAVDAVWLATGGWRWVKVAVVTFKRDMS